MRTFQTCCTIAFLVILHISGCSKKYPTSCNGDTDNLIVISFTEVKVIEKGIFSFIDNLHLVRNQLMVVVKDNFGG